MDRIVLWHAIIESQGLRKTMLLHVVIVTLGSETIDKHKIYQ